MREKERDDDDDDDEYKKCRVIDITGFFAYIEKEFRKEGVREGFQRFFSFFLFLFLSRPLFLSVCVCVSLFLLLLSSSILNRTNYAELRNWRYDKWGLNKNNLKRRKRVHERFL